MKKKKLLTVIMAVLLIFTGCSGGNNQEATSIRAKDADKSLISQSEGNTEAIEKNTEATQADSQNETENSQSETEPVQEIKITSGVADEYLSLDDLIHEFDDNGYSNILNKNDSELKQYMSSACTNTYSLTEAEEDSLLGSYSNRTVNVTADRESAISDIHLYFKVLKSMYSLYNYWGSSNFEAAEENIVNSIPDTISSNDLTNLVRENLSFIEDGHFQFNGKGIFNACNSYIDKHFQFSKDENGYYTIANTNEKLYLDSFSNPGVSMQYYLNDDGNIVYAPGGEFVSAPACTMQFTNGEAVDNNFSCLYNNKKDTSLWHVETDNMIFIHDGSFSSKKGSDQNQKLADLGAVAKDKDYIVLDIRGNGGGTADGVVVFLDYVLNGYTSRSIGKVGTDQYHGVLSKTLDNMLIRKISGNSGSKFSGNKVNTREKSGSTVNYNDKTIVLLVDKGTASSGEEALNMMYYINNTIVIGTSTAGAQYTSNPMTMVLPETGMTVTIPTGVYRENNNNVERTGYVPDIYTDNSRASTSVANMLANYGKISSAEAAQVGR